MADSFRRDVPPSQSPLADVSDGRPSTTVDDDVEALREVIAEQGWTLDSIAAAMGRGETYRSHISRVLSGERPLTHEFKEALPTKLQGAYHARMAERFDYLTAEPATDMRDAERKALSAASFFFRLMASGLPGRASAMVKAAMPTKARRQA